MLYYILNFLLFVFCIVSWCGVIAAISLNNNFYGLIGTISGLSAIAILYVKDYYKYDQDEEGDET